MSRRGPPPPPCGVEFPQLPGETDPKTGQPKRGSLNINQEAFAKSLDKVDQERAKQVRECNKWRGKYVRFVCENVRASLKSPQAAWDVAEAGLEYLHNTMVHIRGDEEIPLKDAMAKYTSPLFKTREIKGTGSPPKEYGVHYKQFGTKGDLSRLTGAELSLQIDKWLKNGVIETSTAYALNKVAENPKWCDLSDQYFVLFGASSAMGPYPILMEYGANVIALDLYLPDGKFAHVWEKLFKTARESSGRLIFPVRDDPKEGASDSELAKVAGCNLITEAPEIRTWLMPLEAEKQLVLFALAYLDGALFVKVSMAMDAIIAELIKGRKTKPALAYLCTPTDCHVCTPGSVAAAKTNFNRTSMGQKLIAALLGMAGPAMAMKRNVEKPVLREDGTESPIQIVDCIIPPQGPNYILAKRLQHWRAILARKAGCVVSSNVAPSTATPSVLSNVVFALSYKGFGAWKPMEVTYPDTSNTVMAALLIRDLRDKSSTANPDIPLANPLCLFTENSFHGGAWRAGYKFAGMGGGALLSYISSAFLVAPYLLVYSALQAQGWGKAFGGVVTGLSEDKPLWPLVGATVSYWQYLGLMEVGHAAIGLTSSNAAMTLLQIFSRIMLVAIVNEFPSVFNSANDSGLWLKFMLFAWTLTEVTRYTYYTIQQVRDLLTTIMGMLVAMKKMKGNKLGEVGDAFKIPFPLVWLRYSLFIVLYPMGVTGELGCLYSSLSSVAKMGASKQSHAIATFLIDYIVKPVFGPLSFGVAFALCLVVYAFGLPPLYLMLLGARKKNLGGKPKGAKNKKA